MQLHIFGKYSLKVLVFLLGFIRSVLLFFGKPFYKIFVFIFLSLAIFLAQIVKIKKTINSKYKNVKRKYKNIKKANAKLVNPKIATTYTLRQRIILAFSYLAFTFLVITITVGILFWKYILLELPDPSSLEKRETRASTKIYDRNGTLLYTFYEDQNRTPIELSDLPQTVIDATVAIEDKEFFEHPGFSIRGITRAFWQNAREGTLYGGSTITQQLIKNTLLSNEKTYIRKLKEVTLAILVEEQFTKSEILEMYLNEVGYGGVAYGIEAASQIYFGKSARDLNLSEAALLAGLPKSPTTYSPFGESSEIAIARRNEVLEQMHVAGFINKNDLIDAQKTEVVFAKNEINIKAPHFVFYIRDILEKEFGREMVDHGGLSVITSLDLNIYEKVQEIVKTEVEKLKNMRVSNGAAVVLNPKTGEILAMVGSTDYFDTKKEGNVNVTTMPRQPGSSIKVVNYANALANGYTLATRIDDTPVSYKVAGQPTYTPKNYEGGYRGTMTLRSALAQSRNIPAVKTLNQFGVGSMIEMGQKMGITTWDNKNRFGLSLTLGGGETTLLDMSYVYATLANEGKKPKVSPILKVTNHKGEILKKDVCDIYKKSTYDNKIVSEVIARESALLKNNSQECIGEIVLDPRIAFLVTDVLKDNVSRSPSFGTNSLFNIPGHPEVAVKTGTSNNLKDNLAIGYTRDYVVAVWVGNNDNSEMAKIASGVTGATPIFNKIFVNLLENISPYQWEVPPGLEQKPICANTGTIPCTGCKTINEWFIAGTGPTGSCPVIEKKEDLAVRITDTPTPTTTPAKNKKRPGWRN